MRVIIAPDSFKESLTAPEVAQGYYGDGKTRVKMRLIQVDTDEIGRISPKS